MSVKKELVIYENKFGTRVVKRVPNHHTVNRLVEAKAVKRAKDIVKIDNKNLAKHKSRLEKAVKEYGRSRG